MNNQTVYPLSIAIPAYNRPQWLQRALISIKTAFFDYHEAIEIIVSDDSSTNECQIITETVLEDWRGKWQYILNSPRLGMAANWNNCLKLALGKYVILLHDDDFLLPEANTILQYIQQYENQYKVFLAGVNVVNSQEKIRKKQIVSTPVYLPPSIALQKLLSNSSYVRFPSMIIHREVWEQIGYFNTTIGEVADLEMWIKIFSQFGVFCFPVVTCAYTVHTEALTTAMFNQNTVNKLLSLFAQVEEKQLLKPAILNRSKSDFFHQFILAGTYRQLRLGNFQEAKNIIKLFQIPSLYKLNFSLKWFLIRLLFNLILIYF